MSQDVFLSSLSRRYAMFISYRHADNLEAGRKWATWLHEAAESYEVPVDLIGRTNLRGESVPSTLYPVFRDEEELPADADLSTNIERALENSALLVVLCSPRSAQSHFVAEEIRYFKELGKGGRILALIIDGEPNASDDPQKLAQFGANAECFPEPLRFGVRDAEGKVDWSKRTEPIAADCRPGGQPIQGWTTVAAYEEELEKKGLEKKERADAVHEYRNRLELAKLKVISGALGVPLGELTQRDKARQLVRAKRRARILGTLSLAFALLAVAVGVLGWMASAAKKLAVQEKLRVITTLANSDFQEGANRLQDAVTAPAGMAYLARSARAGDERAATQIWALYQQQPFWIPTAKTDPLPIPERHLKSLTLPKNFRTVDLNGEAVAPTWFAKSADGKRCITVVSKGDAGEGPITFRFWTLYGNPIGEWQKLDYQGDNYLYGIAGAVLSEDGRFAAIIGQPWRDSQYIELWDVEKGRRIEGIDAPKADGSMPNYQGGTFVDLWFASWKAGTPGPLFVTLSNRGDAVVYRLIVDSDDASLIELGRNSHQRALVQATVDDDADLFLSAAEDQSIRACRITDGASVGWPLTVDGTVTALKINGAEGITASLTGGKSTGWTLLKPTQSPLPAQARLTFTQDKALQKQWGDEKDGDEITGDTRGKEKLRIVNEKVVELSAADGKSLWKHSFPSAMRYARFFDEEKIVVQSTDFITEVWDVKINAPVYPRIDETRLFTESYRSDTVLLSSLSPNGKFMLTRSFFWNAPNVAIHNFTVWDTTTAKPVITPIQIVNSGFDDAPLPNHAEFSSDGAFLFLGLSEGTKDKVLLGIQLEPPSEVLPRMPNLAEALGGFTLKSDGGLEAVKSNRKAVIEAVKSHH